MKIQIDEKTCEKYGLNISEVFLLMAIKTSEDISETLAKLLDEEKIVNKEGFMITQNWNDILESVLLDSEKAQPELDRVESLAIKLMEIFPKGKKDGTSQYFKGNKKDVSLKLKKFLKIYGNYTDEQILTAAHKYVSTFNGQYQYMRVLKYFIMKDVRKVDEEGRGYIEEVSDLASYIENELDDEDFKVDWTAQLT